MMIKFDYFVPKTPEMFWQQALACSWRMINLVWMTTNSTGNNQLHFNNYTDNLLSPNIP